MLDATQRERATGRNWLHLGLAFLAGGLAQVISVSVVASLLPVEEFTRYGLLMILASYFAPVLTGRLDVVLIVRRRMQTALAIAKGHLLMIGAVALLVTISTSLISLVKGDLSFLTTSLSLSTLTSSYILGSFAIGILLKIGDLRRLAQFRALSNIACPVISTGVIALSHSLELGLIFEGMTRLIISGLILRLASALPSRTTNHLHQTINQLFRIWKAFLSEFGNGSLTAVFGAASSYIPFLLVDHLWGVKSLATILFVTRVLSPVSQGAVQVLAPQFVASFRSTQKSIKIWLKYLVLSFLWLGCISPLLISGSVFYQNYSATGVQLDILLLVASTIWVILTSIPSVLAHTPVLLGVHKWWLLVGAIELLVKIVPAIVLSMSKQSNEAVFYIIAICLAPLFALASQLAVLLKNNSLKQLEKSL